MKRGHRVILTVLAVAIGVPVAVIGCAVFMDYNFKLFQGALVAGIESSIASFGPARLNYSAIVSFEYGVPSGVTILVPAPTLEGESIPAFERALAEVEPPPEIVRNEKGTFLKLTEVHADPWLVCPLLGFSSTNPDAGRSSSSASWTLGQLWRIGPVIGFSSTAVTRPVT